MIEHMGGGVAIEAAGSSAPGCTSGTASTAWPASGPPVALSGGPLGVVQAADREISRLVALRARAVAEFAASRLASLDRQQGERGAMSPERWAARPEVLRPVSEWATAELSVALAYTQRSAQNLLERSLTLVTRLPAALAATEAGALHADHLWPLLDLVAPIGDDRLRAEIEAALLGWVADRAARGEITTPAQLRDKARRETLRRGARDAADRLAKAVRERGVHLRGERTEGMAAVTSVLTLPEAQALYGALGAYADALPSEPGDTRTRGQKMADCLMDLVLRPGESDRPPVQVALTLVAAVSTVLGGDEPGELNGQVVPAEVVRQLLRLLTGADPAPGPGGPSAAAASAAPSDAAASGAPSDGPVADSAVSDGDPAAAGGGADGDRVGTPATGDWARGDGETWHGDVDIDPSLERALLEAEERWWADVERGLVADPDPPDERWASAAPGLTAPPVGGPPAHGAPDHGWWAAADRAVDDASQAAYRAQLALAHARRLVRTAETAASADEAAWRASPTGRVDAAADALAALTVAAEADQQSLTDLLARTAGGGLADRPRIALVDALTGALVSLTDLPEIRRAACCGADGCRRDPASCTHDLTGRPGLGAPGPTDGYRPAAALDRFLRARDRRCRFPGCRRPVATGELDHRVRYPDGPTAVVNLAGLCVGDHRGKHQAPGWSHDLAPDGTLTVTTPTGLTVTTAPPPF
ncbi:DUF222 domain-containing protein [Geodermatophilus sp. SYSU D00708]